MTRTVFESVVQHLSLYPFHFSNCAGSEVNSTYRRPFDTQQLASIATKHVERDPRTRVELFEDAINTE